MIKPFRTMYLIILLAVLSFSSLKSQLVLETYFERIEPAQPAVKFGGVATSIAVHPANDNIIYATTNLGGLVKSENHGASWTNLYNFPGGRAVRHVQFAPMNTDNIIVTTAGVITNNINEGGIWLSRDGGQSWDRPASSIPPVTFQMGKPLTGNCIATFPGSNRILVGTSLGLAISENDGGDWTYSSVPGGEVYAAALLKNNEMVIATPNGIFYYNSISGWQRELTGIGRAYRSPSMASHNSFHVPVRFLNDVSTANPLFVTTATGNIQFSRDGGRNWTLVDTLPARENTRAKGTIFVKTAAAGLRADGKQGFDLYVTNRFGIWRKFCERTGANFNYRFSNNWGPILQTEHADLSDMCLDRDSKPWLLSGDGGIQAFHRGLFEDIFSFAGGGSSSNGFHALELTEVKGVYIDERNDYDIYIGTQDNNLMATEDRGRNWDYQYGSEGFFIELPRQVSTRSEANVAYRACAECVDNISNRLFTGSEAMKGLPGASSTYPLVYLHKNTYLFTSFTNALATATSSPVPPHTDFFLSSNYSSPGVNPAYNKVVTANNVVTRGLPKKSVTADPWKKVLYQAYKTTADTRGDAGDIQRVKLMQVMVEGRTESSVNSFAQGTWRFPANRNLGSIGVMPTPFAWYEVFAVNPVVNTHLLAADALNGKAMQSNNGGEFWTEIPELTNLATDNGTKPFAKGRFTNLSCIAFNPDYPQMILAGSRESGIFYSWNGGSNWEKIPGSEKITEVTSFYFQNNNTVWVSSYGRGLWKLRFIFARQRSFLYYLFHNRPSYTFNDEGRFSRLMGMQDNMDNNEFDMALIITDGSLSSMWLRNGYISQAQYTPNSSAIWLTDQKFTKAPFRVTETNTDAQPGGEIPEKILDLQRRGYYISAVLLKDNKLVDVIYGKTPLAFPSEDKPKDFVPVGDKELDERSAPHFFLSAEQNTAGYCTLHPGDKLILQGFRFDATSPYPLQFILDGSPTSLFDAIKVKPDGSFSGSINADIAPGPHTLTVVQAGASQQITFRETDEFMVQHADEKGPVPVDKDSPLKKEQNPAIQKINEFKQKVKDMLHPKN